PEHRRRVRRRDDEPGDARGHRPLRGEPDERRLGARPERSLGGGAHRRGRGGLTTMSFVPTLAGIAWDPEIRGILSVAVGVTVLRGSVYLLLATNGAHRLGFLLPLAAVFGWLTIPGLVWLIYPPIMGPAGRAPSWEVEEIVYGDLTNSMLEEAHGVDTSALPDPEEIDELTAEEVDELSEQYADELDGWTLLAASDASRGE